MPAGESMPEITLWSLDISVIWHWMVSACGFRSLSFRMTGAPLPHSVWIDYSAIETDDCWKCSARLSDVPCSNDESKKNRIGAGYSVIPTAMMKLRCGVGRWCRFLFWKSEVWFCSGQQGCRPIAIHHDPEKNPLGIVITTGDGRSINAVWHFLANICPLCMPLQISLDP